MRKEYTKQNNIKKKNLLSLSIYSEDKKKSFAEGNPSLAKPLKAGVESSTHGWNKDTNLEKKKKGKKKKNFSFMTSHSQMAHQRGDAVTVSLGGCIQIAYFDKLGK